MTIAQRPLTGRRELLRIFAEDRLVCVVRTPTAELALRAGRAAAAGGVRMIEITLTVPEAYAAIETLAMDEDFASRGAIVGAGTVLSGSQAEDALSAGARFLVGPTLVPEMIVAAHARDALAMPGTLTPTEMLAAANLGADFIKIYPIGPVGGPEYVRNVRRALPHLPLVATGNIAYDDIPAYLAAGVVGFGIGEPLVPAELLESGDHDAAVRNVRRFLGATRAG
ncbi:MAG: bifunctional 4-hydroxy-2-oxoglutarate aldolase/2-dehydro-3-deoxy-phosphogluconate aldolase [Candidatus Limnocylindria bacterium]